MLPDELFLGIHMYGVMIALGLLCAFIVIFVYGKKKHLDTKLTDFVFYDGVVSIAVGFLSAALFQATYNYIENPSLGFQFGSGITFIGGLIGGAACFLIIYFIFRKRLNIRLLDILSIIPCSIFVAHGFGRIGCFFAGCCYGKPTSSFLGVQFPHLAEPVHATQLYEAAFLFIMFGICSYLVLKKDFKHNMGVYLISYGVFRFLIEFLRGDSRGSTLLGIISPSQFWSIFMVIGGVASILLVNYLENKRAYALAGYTPESLKDDEAAAATSQSEISNAASGSGEDAIQDNTVDNKQDTTKPKQKSSDKKKKQ